jgi:hypothetical protein
MKASDQARTRLIDGAGRIHDYNVYREQKSAGHRLSDERFVEYVVKNLGYIVLRSTDGRMRLQARRGAVSGTSLAQLMYILALEQPRTTMLMILDTIDMQWSHHVLGRWELALLRIDQLFRAPERQTIDVVAEPVGALSLDSPLHWAMDLFREQATTFAPHMLDLKTDIRPARFSLYERPLRTDAFQLVKASAGFPSEVQRCLDRLVGFDVRDRPDFDYGQMCHNAYNRVVGSGEPILESVQGPMRWRKLEVSAHHYRRLLLPLRDRSGRSWVLSATVAESSTIVSPQARQEHR